MTLQHSTSVKSAHKKEFRRILPQVIAGTAQCLLHYVIGVILSFSTIVIAELLVPNESLVHPESLYFTKELASWFGSIPILADLLGTIFSPMIVDRLGRKRMMLISSMPFMAGFILMYFSNSVLLIFVAMILLAFTCGLDEAALLSYIAEVCEPSVRGILLGISSAAGTSGQLTVYILGTVTNWRIASLICFVLPAIVFTILIFVPESPIWLLSKNRQTDAKKSLQWLRGWVPPENVEEELNLEEQYLKDTKRCTECQRKKLECHHPPSSMLLKLKSLTERRNFSPLFIIITLLFCDYCLILKAMRPFLVPIMRAYGTPINPNLSTVVIGVSVVTARLSSASIIPFFGKRKVVLFGIAGCLVCSCSLGTYGQLYLPANWNSFTILDYDSIEKSTFPLVAITIFYFFANSSISNIPFIMISELYPFKTRALLTCISTAIGKLINFTITQLYITMEMSLSLPGVMWFSTIICLLGIVTVYFIMPNTEGFTMQEIEIFFSDKNHKITNTNIKKNLEKKKTVDANIASINPSVV